MTLKTEDYQYFLERLAFHIENDDSIEHAGVKGMKWGVRRSESQLRAANLKRMGPSKLEVKIKTGETLSLENQTPSNFNKALARVSKNYAESYNKGAAFSIKNSDGKKVGFGSMNLKEDGNLYLNFITISKSERGKGYASACLKAAEEFGKATGAKKMTLEVPGDAPDARHIYEKMGFKVTKEATKEEIANDPIWGGLTEMEYVFKEVKQSSLKHSEDSISFRTSKWDRFDPDFAEMIRTKHPDIWALGGNIKGNDQYRKLYPITKRNGVPNSEMEVNALKLREAWVARHYKDFRIAGVIAQIKWLAVGSRGEQYMKNLVKEEILKRSEVKQSDDMSIEEALVHAGVKGMKWGVRKSAKKQAAQRTSYKKGPKSLSDAELRRRVNRMETEKRYVDLNPTTAKSQAGKKFASKVLSESGSKVAAVVVAAGVGVAGAAIKSKMSG
jgi:ribosomal protein S18 acetylase RimI-like enzyme